MEEGRSSFLGRGWSFPPSFDPTSGTVQMVADEADIRQSLVILFGTLPGERIMVPDYGCDLQPFVFDGIDDTTLSHIRAVISDAILYFEPRIILEGIDIDASRGMDGVLLITLDYLIERTNSRSNLVFPYYVSEGTLVRRP